VTPQLRSQRIVDTCLSLNMRQHLVSLTDAARKLGHDRRTLAKIAPMVEIRVVTRVGNLYSLDDLRHALFVHAPHLRRPTRSDAATRMITLQD
jgi:hypothetical protein